MKEKERPNTVGPPHIPLLGLSVSARPIWIKLYPTLYLSDSHPLALAVKTATHFHKLMIIFVQKRHPTFYNYLQLCLVLGQRRC